MPKPADADRVGDHAVARSARRPEGRPLGRRQGRLEHAHDLDDAAESGIAGRDALGSRVHGQLRDSGQLQRLRDLGHLESGEAGAGADVHLPGVAERHLGLQEPAVHVVRSDQQPRRLRLRRRAGSGEQGSRARHSHLRYLRHQASEARDERADVPRLAHAHGGDPAGRSEQRLHLRLRHVRRALGRRTAGLPGRQDRRRSELGAVPYRSDQGSARAPETGARSSASRASSTSCRWRRQRRARRGRARNAGRGRTQRPRPQRAARRGAPDRRRGGAGRGRGNGGPPRRRRGPNQCHDITVYPADRPRRRRVRGPRPAARHP